MSCFFFFSTHSNLRVLCVVAGQTSLSFSGNSYIKYRVTDSTQSGEMRLGLRIRTLQRRGVIMFTRVNPCTMLKVLTFQNTKDIFKPTEFEYLILKEVFFQMKSDQTSLHRLKEGDSGSSWTVTTPWASWVSLADQSTTACGTPWPWS